MKPDALRKGAVMLIMLLMPFALLGQEIQKLEDETGKYEGEVKDGKRHGQGTNIGIYGEKYVGEWKDNVPDGYGVYTERNGIRYEGYWKDGTQHGKGKATYADGGTYEGLFVEGGRAGLGTYVLPNGLKYVGEFVNNRAVGKGHLYYPNGTVYEGDMKKYVPVGEGVSTFPNGDKYSGKWNNGVPEGQGTYSLASGEIAEGVWEKGVYSYKGAGGKETEICISLNNNSLSNSSHVKEEVKVAQLENSKVEVTVAAEATKPVAENTVKPDEKTQNKSGNNTARKPIFTRGVSSTKIKDRLFEEAIERGYGYNSVDAYTIINEYNMAVYEGDMIAFLQDKGYEVGRYSKKRGNFGASYVSLYEMEFYPAGKGDRYAYSIIKEDYDPAFDQFKGPGRFYHGKYSITCRPAVLWSGDLVNGLLNGHGVGLICEGDQYSIFDGDFVMGFPKSEFIAVQWIKETDRKSKVAYGSPVFDEIAEEVATADSDYLAAIKEYAKATYDEKAAIMEDKFEKALVLTEKGPGAIPQTKAIREGVKNDRQLFQNFIQVYGTSGVDPKGILPKVNELVDLYVVLESVTKEFNSEEYVTLGVLHFNWSWDNVDKQRDIMYEAKVNSEIYSHNQDLSFRKFYAMAAKYLEQKENELEEHIAKNYGAFLKERERQINGEKENRIHNANYDSAKSYAPSGNKVDGILTYTLQKNGMIYLKNGDYLEYNIEYKKSGAVDHYVLKYSYPRIDSDSREFRSFDAMVDALVKASKNQ